MRDISKKRWREALAMTLYRYTPGGLTMENGFHFQNT